MTTFYKPISEETKWGTRMKVWIVSYWDEVDKVFDSKEKAEQYVKENDDANKRMYIQEHDVI